LLRDRVSERVPVRQLCLLEPRFVAPTPQEVEREVARRHVEIRDFHLTVERLALPELDEELLHDVFRGIVRPHVLIDEGAQAAIVVAKERLERRSPYISLVRLCRTKW